MDTIFVFSTPNNPSKRISANKMKNPIELHSMDFQRKIVRGRKMQNTRLRRELNSFLKSKKPTTSPRLTSTINLLRPT
ncbi:hypothetical protein Y032_0020g76 [Ancylostoma ceylanicum]|uniref:Uncharacterized protein n=1 Tax=Ancylostoma ceylanicum TaxID=53326 RepID=A0A016V1W9_9BILA|nr:hypothetical protein Y032_0020g76 [Ancylostoma ceylanicum]